MVRVKQCDIGICTISDHNCFGIYLPASCHWRFQPSLLNDPKFVEFLEKEWVSFIDTNKLPDTDPSLLWETAKAYIRGSIIYYPAAQKRGFWKDNLS